MFKVATGSQLSYSNYSPNTRQKRHGTMVSSVIAGRRNGEGYRYTHGVAFNAKVFFVAIQLSEPDETYDPIDLGDDQGNNAPDYSGVVNFFKDLFSFFKSNNVKIINNSYGYPGNVFDYTEAQIRNAFPKAIAEIAQEDVPASEKSIFVWSAGNAGGYADQGVYYGSPEVFSGMAYLIPELQGHSVAVAAVNEDGVISDFSNRCGVSKDYCIAAPGGSITVAYATSADDTGIYDSTDACVSTNSCYASVNGTSFAAPHVSGGIALLQQFFDGQLGNTEILERLFLTANKEGIYSDRDIYGQGLMDLNAATSPVGQTAIATINSLESLVFPVKSTSIGFVGGLMGDAISSNLMTDFIVLDELGAPFHRNLISTSNNFLPSLENLTYRYANPFIRVQEVSRKLSGSGLFTLGFKVSDYDYDKFSSSLWPRDKEKIKYFGYKNFFNQSSFILMGSGMDASLLFTGNNDRKSMHQFFQKKTGISPFLAFANEGSFVGAGKLLSKGSSFSGALFTGQHPDLIFSPNHSNTTNGLLLEYQTLIDEKEISIQIGAMNEDRSMLGTSFNGAYGHLNDSLTYFSGVSSSFNLLNFKVLASYYYGITDPNLSQKGLIQKVGRISSSSFNLSFFKSGFISNKDNFGFRISQPLRVDSGEVNFSIPYKRNVNRKVLFRDFSGSISPTGRQIDLEFIYNSPLKRGNIISRMGLIKDSGNISRNKSEPYFETRLDIYLK